MSIIHEALKKAARLKRGAKTPDMKKESQTIDSNNKSTEINLETQPAPLKKPIKRQAALILPITIGLMAILITTAIFLLNNYLLRKRPGVETASLNQIPKEKIPPLLTNKPIRKEGSLDSFVLTGIVYDKEPMAVINGSVYTEGEYVSGARIVKISKQLVLLEKGGKQIELKVK
ncbi:MAG: hypothetical protein JSW18_05805 [Candidatus Omnitrophota bacterium]|nr:MAG: hypothetical protein JSW18_05805 [Candidatus Omnitrophota bacterium]